MFFHETVLFLLEESVFRRHHSHGCDTSMLYTLEIQFRVFHLTLQKQEPLSDSYFKNWNFWVWDTRWYISISEINESLIYSEISEKKKKLQGLSHLRKTKWMNSKIKYSIQVYEFECNLTVTLSVVCKDSVILKSVYKTRSQYIRHKKMVKCEKIIST